MKLNFKVAVISVVFVIVAFSSICLWHNRYLFRQKPKLPFSSQQIQQAVQKVGGTQVLEQEASGAILHFGRKDGPVFSDFINCPAISNLAALLGGEVTGIWPEDGFGVPPYVGIRRGSHLDYQFVYVFGARAKPVTNAQGLMLVEGSVYLRNTSER